MYLRLIALAAMTFAGGAHALTPAQLDAARANGTLKEVYVAGASAQRLFLAAWFKDQCQPGSYDVFFDTSAATGKSHRAYSCNLAVQVGNWTPGTPVLFAKRDAGGSFQGVNPVALAQPQDFMTVSGGNCVSAGPSPSPDIQVAGFTCGIGAGTLTSRLADAGVSDVEPALFQKAANLPAPNTPLTKAQQNALSVSSFNQTLFGIAVNRKAYRALQAAQGLAQDDSAANQPSLPTAFVAAALEGKVAGGTALSWSAVIPTSVDAAAASKQMNVCRRGIGSGTQASTNAYFLSQGCTTGTSALPIIGQTTGKTNSSPLSSPALAETGGSAWVLNSGTGDLETCLGNTVENLGGSAYGLGMVSRENNPFANGGDKGYRFVKLDGVAPLRDVAKLGGSKAGMGKGYDFVYVATAQYNRNTLTDAGTKAFVTSMIANAAKPAQLSMADVDTQEGVMALPKTVPAAYDSITDPVTLKFLSRVDRNTNASCAPLRLVK